MTPNLTPDDKLKMLWAVYIKFFEAMEDNRKKPSPGSQVILAYLDDVLNQPVLPEDFLDKLAADVAGNNG